MPNNKMAYTHNIFIESYSSKVAGFGIFSCVPLKNIESNLILGTGLKSGTYNYFNERRL